MTSLCIKKINIASVLDTFTYETFKYEANFIQLTPENWKQEISNIKIDFLFVESAWKGKDNLWDEKIKDVASELVDIVEYFRLHKIPTVFWNKEDPYHFGDFIETARLFDFVFTTDIQCIPLYKKYLKHENIYLLPFACQPQIHNPIEKYERKDAFVFAGAYYKRFKERNKQFLKAIEYLDKVGVIDIYDRNYGKDTVFLFPQNYQKYIRGKLEYTEIDKAYKGYQYAINLNSIITSPSMFSRRVLELMASNTIVLSNYALGIKLLLGDLVLFTDDIKTFENDLKCIKDNQILYKKQRLLALRKVLSEHTVKIRLKEIVSKVLSYSIDDEAFFVLCVTYISNQFELNNIYKIFESQTYENKILRRSHSLDIY